MLFSNSPQLSLSRIYIYVVCKRGGLYARGLYERGRIKRARQYKPPGSCLPCAHNRQAYIGIYNGLLFASLAILAHAWNLSGDSHSRSYHISSANKKSREPPFTNVYFSKTFCFSVFYHHKTSLCIIAAFRSRITRLSRDTHSPRKRKIYYKSENQVWPSLAYSARYYRRPLLPAGLVPAAPPTRENQATRTHGGPPHAEVLSALSPLYARRRWPINYWLAPVPLGGSRSRSPILISSSLLVFPEIYTIFTSFLFLYLPKLCVSTRINCARESHYTRISFILCFVEATRGHPVYNHL